MRIGLGGLADVAHRLWSAATGGVTRTFERLSTGLRINAAVDDAAGLAISEGLTARINGYDQGMRNAQDGISLTQTAEGGLSSMHDTLQRMRTLAVQASNGLHSTEDRAAMQREMNALVEEIDSVVNRTEFDGQHLLDGSLALRHVQVGPDAGDRVDLDIARFDSVGLGLRDLGAGLVDPDAFAAASSGVSTASTTTTAPAGGAEPVLDPSATGSTPDPTTTTTTTTKNGKGGAKSTTTGGGPGATKKAPQTTAPTVTSPTPTAAPAPTTATASTGWSISVMDIDSAHEAITAVDDAIWSVSHGRADLGAVQNRLERSLRSAGNARDNLDAARSRMRDADMAHEMSQLLRQQICTQAAAAMTAQAQVAMRNTATALLV